MKNDKQKIGMEEQTNGKIDRNNVKQKMENI